ncbi:MULTISPECIES: hypothetical protein [Methylobacterium]|uniref:hypothetical protein n=1 Tax=Methylobacterium TaxID=407 RepID=UPI00104BCEE5|nr:MULTISPECIES: hypothetical protein [Methylobacterium]MDR7037068.1 hypothetical protein [Methylobacterium sp. BE186]
MRTALALLLLGTSLPGAALGQSAEILQPPLTLPETLRGTVRVPLAEPPSGIADTLPALFPALAACWALPSGLDGLKDLQITARFALRRDGTLIGTPRITFTAGTPDAAARSSLVRATLTSIRRCTPARITPALGRAIAGRPLALRLIDRGPER